MTCERIEELLSAYLEGELRGPERAEFEAHLTACPGCAELAGLMERTVAAAAAFPEAEPSAALMARLYAIPEEKREKRRLIRPVFEWLARPALQPVYAAAAALIAVVTFVAFHPEAQGIRKKINLGLHQGIGTVEKLYADAGFLKGEVGALAGNVVKSFDALGLSRPDDKK
jgi:anti-sigma factor RsiW